jgi:hypothetical protein
MNPFFLKNTIIGPLELRPWTMTTQDAIHELELSKLPESKQVIACAWLQSREPEEVEQAISDKTAQDKIAFFTKHFPLGLAKPLADWCRSQVQCVDEGKVEIIPQPGGRSDAPKN